MSRPMGQILLDMEVLLEEMVDSHDLQASDIIFLVYGWIQVHRPGALEVYTEDGSNPVLTYGPKKEKKKKK